jgi:hypothetical protein
VSVPIPRGTLAQLKLAKSRILAARTLTSKARQGLSGPDCASALRICIALTNLVAELSDIQRGKSKRKVAA